MDENDVEFLRMCEYIHISNDVSTWSLQDAFEFGWLTRDQVNSRFFTSPEYQHYLLEKIPGGEKRIEAFKRDHELKS